MSVTKTQKRSQIEAIYPLSPMQQGMLFNALFNTGVNTDFVQLRFIFRGNLNVLLFRTAWEMVVKRHAILRTQFKWDNVNQPIQIVWQEIKLPWIEYDWRQLASEELEKRFQQLLQADFAQGVDLAKAPLYRLTLVQEAEDCFQFIWSYHHSLLDGWSNAMVLQELFTLYEELLNGTIADLPAVYPYKDYISWLQRQDRSQAETFWRETLAGFTAANALPHAPANSRGPISDYREQRRTLAPSATTRLQASAQSHHLTLNTILQAAWSLLLSCYSGDQNVVFGSVVSGRPGEIPGVDSMIGLFINTLPVRVDIRPRIKLLSWLQELQHQQLIARQYEYISLANIQQWSSIPVGEPLFESLVVFANFGGKDHTGQRIGDVTVEEAPDSVGHTTFPLVVGASVIAEQLVLGMTYDGERFSAAEISRMLEHLAVLLEKFPTSLDQPLGDISFLSAHAQQQILHDWNNTSAPYPDNACLPDLIQAQAKARPDAIALAFEEQQLTYQELDALVERVATHLQNCGIGPEVLCGICMERSLEMIIGVLGILSAGGAYVPLDPVYPQERLEYMCVDAQVAAVVTQHHLASRFSTLTVPILHLDDVANLPPAVNTLEHGTHPDNLIYVIYTSGSTGKPKGCMVTHRGLCNFMTAAKEVCGDLAGKRMLQFASLSFDASIGEMAIALTSGATLQLIQRDTMLSGDALQSLLHRCAISTSGLPPSVLAALPPSALPDLQTLIVSGEPCTAEVVDQWAPGRRFFNFYGPAEATIAVTKLHCQTGQGRPTIGTPFINTELYILDRNLQPVPVDTSGELYISSISLARGYLQRPDLTAERFIPNPFSQEPGTRLYKTGDIVKYHEDGQIEFIGRSDHQVKIRGVRIELGEIEAVIEQLDEIQRGVVIVHEDPTGEKQLVAYLVPKRDQQINLERVQNALHRRLTHYMLPGALIVLDELPLTVNGKVDQSKLPPPDSQNRRSAASTRPYQPPRDEIEIRLAQIFEATLHIHPVGITDDFFDLGGHSLLAVRLMSEIQKHLQTRIALSVIFQNRTIAALANILRQQKNIPSSPLVALRSEGHRPPFFAVHAGNGHVACYYGLVSQLPTEQPFYGLQDLDIYDTEGKDTSVEDMASNYIDAIRQVQPTGPYYLGGYSFGGLVAFEMAQQLTAMGQEVAWLTILDGVAPARENQQAPLATNLDLLATIVGEATHKISQKSIQDVYNELQSLTFEEQLDRALQILREANVELIMMDREWLREQTLLYARRLRVGQAYQAHIYSGHITLFRSQETDKLEHENDATEDLGWQYFTRYPLEIHTIPGYHATMLSEPYVQEFARLFQHCLEQRQGV